MQLRDHRPERRGAATVELAVLLPLLVFLFVIGVDFARVFYNLVVLNNAARSGAIYASQDATYAQDEDGIKKAVLDEATGFSPAPTVTTAHALDSAGNPLIIVTVRWTFHTIARFPGVPDTLPLTRTVQMRVAPILPKGS